MTAQEPFVLILPFTGLWIVQNSPASRVPSHGTELFGSSHAIDFVPVDSNGRSAPRSLGSMFGTEPADAFIGFGRPILAPVSGEVVRVHDGEDDHVARRSIGAQLGYALTQRSRVREGAPGIAGNHVVIRCDGALVLLAHLRAGSVRPRLGDRVSVGEVIGECGNSGNSTEPHLHVQVSDSVEQNGRGIPLAFVAEGERFWVPRNGAIVAA
ncbi:M23 family metallopeptidase [Microbacterium sp. WCS2018Hpa-9]|uniref:M23 family metallopeptidase n=1 Tax=Microbacterium sp. WCS2018Hpa-9 TaxID=3073635 RepID=UPI00288BC06B|nr:M23 family metallopeptidase [Microbacterium sp. WCS2018Hpa-9]